MGVPISIDPLFMDSQIYGLGPPAHTLYAHPQCRHVFSMEELWPASVASARELCRIGGRCSPISTVSHNHGRVLEQDPCGYGGMTVILITSCYPNQHIPPLLSVIHYSHYSFFSLPISPSVVFISINVYIMKMLKYRAY